jgi:hypothetical protein
MMPPPDRDSVLRLRRFAACCFGRNTASGLDAGGGLGDLEPEQAVGKAPARLIHCERALLTRLRPMSEVEYESLPDSGEGLGNRLMRAAKTGASLEKILSAAKTKRYAEARLRRMLVWAFLGMDRTVLKFEPAYLRVLGFNPHGAALLNEMRKKAKLPVITKPAHVRRLNEAGRRMFELDARATDLYALCMPDLSNAPGGWSGLRTRFERADDGPDAKRSVTGYGRGC